MCDCCRALASTRWTVEAESKTQRAGEGGTKREADTDTDTYDRQRSDCEGGRPVTRRSPWSSSSRFTCWSSLWVCGGSLLHLGGKSNLNMSPKLFICVVLVVCHRTQTCSGFNIDERFPVIKEGQTKGSFFGFSVAMHQLSGGSRGTKKYL